MLDIWATYTNFSVKEREDGYNVWDFGGKNLRAHANQTPKLDCREIHSGNVFHCGFYIVKWRSNQLRMIFNKGERVNTDRF